MDSIYPRRESAFDLGCNYWPRLSGPRMWRDFDEAGISEELGLLRDSGMTTVRAFCFWPDFMPTRDRVEPQMLERLQLFMALCQVHGIGVFLTPVVGHMSGENWPPAWLDDPADLYHVEDLLCIQERYVRTIAATVAGSPALRGHIISNEMPLFAGVGTLETVTGWANRLYAAVRAGDPVHPISIGDGVWSLWGEETGFRPNHPQDFLGLHMYPSETDPLRHTFMFGLNVRMAAMYGKPVLMEEFGAQHTVFGEEEIGGFANSVLYESWANGATGALWWCGFDFPLLDDLPYSHHPFELKFGMHDTDGRAKPAAQAFHRFSKALPLLAGLEPQKAQVAHLIPSFLNTRYPFSWDDLDGMKSGHVQAFTLARLAGVPVGTFMEPPDTREKPNAAVLAIPADLPVIHAGAIHKLRSSSWREIDRWVHAGGTFVMSFDFGSNGIHAGTWHQDFGGFFGVKPRLRFGLSEAAPNALTLTRDLGQLKAGTTMQLPAANNAWHGTPLLADAVDAEVYAVDNLNRPCLWRARRGVGTVWLFAFPVEHSPSWTDAEYAGRASVLREIFASAGVAMLEQQSLGVVGSGDADRRFWMNHSWAPVNVNLPDGTWKTLDGDTVTGVAAMAAKSFDVFTRCTEN